MSIRLPFLGAFVLLVVSTSIFMFSMGQPTAAQQDIETCVQYPQLNVHLPVRVKAWPPLANFVRNTPGFEGDIIGRIPPGNPISLLPEGMPPVCADGIYWWYVEWEGVIGWTAEGNGQDQYWLENFYLSGTPTHTPDFPPPTVTPYPPTITPTYPPVTATSTPIVPPTVAPPTVTPTPIPGQCALPPRLTIGERGRVLPGPANLLRVSPNDLSWRSIIGRIPADGVFTVQAGPYCGEEGRLWWYVNYQGVQGWTAEGENGTYWLEPVQ